MSRDSQEMRETRAALLAELARELRQFNGLSASYFRAVAARNGMTATDMQVIDMLDGAGPMTAGQLAELTGLTTGAITGMLKRLEEAGIVRRESDPEDGRRVIVRLVQEKRTRFPSPAPATRGMMWWRATTMSNSRFWWSSSNAATRSPGRRCSACARLRRARAESTPPHWEKWRLVSLSSPPEPSSSHCARTPSRPRSIRLALRARRRK